MKSTMLASLVGIFVIIFAWLLQSWLHVSADGVIAVVALGIATAAAVEADHD